MDCTRVDVERAAFPAWYPILADLTIQSIILPLPSEFVNYLHEDQIYLVPDDESTPESDGSEEEDRTKCFSQFTGEVQDGIKRLGGAVFPKLNWSAPADAAWISATNDLKCCSANDVYLLLKASDFITHDLTRPYEYAGGGIHNSYVLVLKQWKNITASMEFRCFVNSGCVVAIAQRSTNYYDFLQSLQSDIRKLILDFHTEKLQPRLKYNKYVFDVIVSEDIAKVTLVDVNPFSEQTDGLLFTWSEIQELPLDLDCPVFRLIEANSEPHAPKFAAHRVPRDIVDVSSAGETIADVAQRFQTIVSQSSMPHE